MNVLKRIFILFLIFNLTFVSKVQAEATFNDINGDGSGFDVSAQDTTPRGIDFNNDGTKMFVVGDTDNDINEYTLSTAFDLSTATFNDINGDGSGFDISGQDDKTQYIKFNNDGTIMYYIGNTDNEIYVYTLSTGFDLTTATFNDINGDGTGFDITDQDGVPRGLTFNNDGTKMFVVGDNGNEINSYTLSVGFDLTSTVTHVGSFDISSQATNPQGIAFNITGTKMFVVSNDGDDINEYTLSCAFKVTSSGKCEEPPKIKDVRGINDAQINTAKKFAEDTRVATFKRLDILRANKYQNTSAQRIELLFQNELFKKVSNNVASSTQAKFNPIKKLDQILPNDWEAWTEGSISFGKIGETSLSSAQDIDGFGITLGADRKMDEDQILGVAVRVGNTDVDIGTFGSAVDTNALSFSVYGINSLEDKNFLKHVFGVSYLDSDIVRKDEGNTNTHTGDRDGKQVFGSLDIGREYEGSDLTVSSIGSIDGSYTALDSYTESGTNAISYNDQDIKSLMASLGVLIDRDINLENSNVKSRVNLEYGKEFASNSKVVTSYVSDSESFEYQADNKNRDIYTAGLGLDLKHEQGLTISTDYERQQIKGHGFINKFTLSAGFLYKKETELVLDLDNDMSSNFRISKALDLFDMEFNLENDFSNQENNSANLSLSSKF